MSVRLSEHLPLLAEAPDGIKKLRGLILELAVRGKLVPQDPKDEPANELLKRIGAEKARLVAEEKIRKDKPLPPVDADETPFSLPVGWEWVRLDKICHDWGQKTPDAPFTYIDVSAIDNLRGNIEAPNVVAASDAPSRARKLVRQDTVIYSTVRPYLLNIAVIDRVLNPEPIASTAFAVLHPLAGILSRYVFWYLRSPVFVRYVESVQTGIAYPAINDTQFFGGVFPLSPIAEQHRIVAKVDELMALCDRMEAEQADAEAAHATLVQTLLGTLTQSRDAAELAANWQRLSQHLDTLFTTEASLDTLKKTILQLAVMGKLVPQDPNDEPASELLKRIAAEKARLEAEGACRISRPSLQVGEEDQPFDVPEGWTWTTVDSISLVGTGTTPSRTNPAYFNPPSIPWVTSGETRDPFIMSTAEKVSPLALEETNLTVYPVGTLVVAMYGQGKTRGQISELKIEAATNQACSAIVPLLPESQFRKYIKLYFEKIYDEIREEAAGGAQPNLNVGKIKATLLSLPPIAEQHRIVAKVDELMALCDSLKADLAESRARQARLAATLIESALLAA